MTICYFLNKDLLLRLNSQAWGEDITILLWWKTARHFSDLSLSSQTAKMERLLKIFNGFIHLRCLTGLSLLSGDGLMFFRFRLCLVTYGCYCSLFRKSKGSVLLSSLMSDYQTFCFYFFHLTLVRVAVEFDQRFYWEWWFC